MNKTMLMRRKEKQYYDGEINEIIVEFNGKQLNCDVEDVYYNKGIAYDYLTGLRINNSPIRTIKELTEYVNKRKDDIIKVRTSDAYTHFEKLNERK